MNKFRTILKSLVNNVSRYRGKAVMFSLGLSKYNYADAVIWMLLRKIYKKFDLIEISSVNVSINYYSAKKMFDENIKNIFYDMFNFGYFCINPESLTYVKASECSVVNGCKKGLQRSTDSEVDVYFDTIFIQENRSIRCVCEDILKSLDNSLNANNTMIERLGAMIVGTPDNASQVQAAGLSPDEKKELEKDLQSDYGNLQQQSSIMLLSQPLKLQRIALGGKDLPTIDNVKLYTQILCEIVGIPYYCLAISGQSTYENMGQSELQLQELSESFTNYFLGIMEKYGVKANYKVINNKYKLEKIQVV